MHCQGNENRFKTDYYQKAEVLQRKGINQRQRNTQYDSETYENNYLHLHDKENDLETVSDIDVKKETIF